MHARASAPVSITLLAVVLAATASASTWTIQTLDAQGDCGQYCSLQADTNGNLFAVYLRDSDGTLHVISRLDGTWQASEVVDGSGLVAGDCGIATTATGSRRFSYRRSDTHALYYVGSESPAVWQVETALASAGDVGQYVSQRLDPDGSTSVSFADVTQGSLLLMTRNAGGAWSAPATVDAGPGRGEHSDHVYRPGVGHSFCERASDQGALVFADPGPAASWTRDTIVASADDVGRYASLKAGSAGALSLTFENATQGFLMLTACDALGPWSAPAVVDPWPNRGGHSDHARRVDGGLAIAERDAAQNCLMFTGTGVAAPNWVRGMIHENGDSGRFVSLVRSPRGGFRCTFYHISPRGQGSIYHAGLNDDFAGAVTVAAESVGTRQNEDAYVSLAVDGNGKSHLSYRRPASQDLRYGYADSSIVVAVDDLPGGGPWLPAIRKLYANYPNPFNPATTIAFDLPQVDHVTLEVVDVMGRRVRLLADASLPAGRYRVRWDGTDERGQPVASGVYFSRMRVDSSVETKRMSLVR